MAEPRKPYPTLKTERIILREPTLEDCDAYHLILSQHEVTQHINLRDAPGLERSCKFVSWMTKLYRRNKGCAWIMEHATTGHVMGAVRIDAISQSSRVGTVGYEMHPEFWGQGLMTEAINALVQCAYTRFKINRLEAWTLPGNPGSDRVLLKNGFQYEGTQREKKRFKGKYHDLRIFGRLQHDKPLIRPYRPRKAQLADSDNATVGVAQIDP